ncbi:26S proteasome subunit P45 family protein [Vittaforma corneae ATCC 50505]|uniref:26S proteasome regulatory subunit 6B homolog n=1 Tax=Vittaforma corneae (strain ATCC 50505) TaxID=993615 RepID=L2GKP3_VITCO|nr:26S proteasome subunit P45 family protein [Vittaforma corneae ATCC 50505]ELA41421.1 26S proteasome subunit P45 family protein [Vittaforma corneae ATCC 50505]
MEVKNKFINCFNKEEQLKLLKIRKEYLAKEIAILKKELSRAKEEINRVKSVPLLMGQFLEMIDKNTAIVSSTAGSNAMVRILSTIDREALVPNTTVALHRHSSAIVDVLPPEADSSIPVVGEEEKPNITYSDIGGLDVQKQEIRETVELPILQFDLYKAIGIEPPRGVLLYGPPGTGKTMLVKAVAHHTNSTFIRVNGSEFIQKYLGEGPRMVRDVFRLAREKAPSIVFIDEVDSIATKRFDASTSADREVQRVLIELLNQMDGFDQSSNVKVIMATNRPDTIDPALLRPGRLDRKIEFPLPDRRQKRLVFNAIIAKMSLDSSVDLESIVKRSDKLSCADINSVCQEAGMLAVRASRYVIKQEDFEEAYSKVIGRKDSGLFLYN